MEGRQAGWLAGWKADVEEEGGRQLWPRSIGDKLRNFLHTKFNLSSTLPRGALGLSTVGQIDEQSADSRKCWKTVGPANIKTLNLQTAMPIELHTYR